MAKVKEKITKELFTRPSLEEHVKHGLPIHHTKSGRKTLIEYRIIRKLRTTVVIPVVRWRSLSVTRQIQTRDGNFVTCRSVLQKNNPKKRNRKQKIATSVKEKIMSELLILRPKLEESAKNGLPVNHTGMELKLAIFLMLLWRTPRINVGTLTAIRICP